MNQKKVLHVGCGPNQPGRLFQTFRGTDWQEVRLDIDPAVEPDILGDIRDMNQVASNSFDALWSSHNVEHLYAHEVPLALGEFFRVIKPGGYALVTLPDIQAVAAAVAQGNLEGVLYQSPEGPISAIDILWGHRPPIAAGNTFMAHKTGFTGETLKRHLMNAGFCNIEMEHQGYNLWGFGHKPPRA